MNEKIIKMNRNFYMLGFLFNHTVRKQVVTPLTEQKGSNLHDETKFNTHCPELCW